MAIVIPTEVNGYPVLAALPTGPARWAVVCERKRGAASTPTRFVVWSVERSETALGGWWAENGRYDMTFDRALSVMADRAGFAPKS